MLKRFILEACLRVHKSIGELDVEEQIAEYLKHAPNKAGGSRYKVYCIYFYIVVNTLYIQAFIYQPTDN
jgi:hypothetical protein